MESHLKEMLKSVRWRKLLPQLWLKLIELIFKKELVLVEERKKP